MSQKSNSLVDYQMAVGQDTTDQLKQCKEMVGIDLQPTMVPSICKKLSQEDHLGARMAIEKAMAEQSRPWCIIALKTAASIICTISPCTMIKEATFNLLNCK